VDRKKKEAEIEPAGWCCLPRAEISVQKEIHIRQLLFFSHRNLTRVFKLLPHAAIDFGSIDRHSVLCFDVVLSRRNHWQVGWTA
jgi:hypothetical protein